jgi:hypothetical protein
LRADMDQVFRQAVVYDDKGLGVMTGRAFDPTSTKDDGVAVLLVGDRSGRPWPVDAATAGARLIVPEFDIAGLNRAIAETAGEFIVLIDSRLVLFEDEWLEHALAFMKRRPDVGLVGLGGWHEVDAEGRCRDPVHKVDCNGWRADSPVGRFSQVTAVGAGGLVARRDVLRLDESFHYLAAALVDLSLRCLHDGIPVYSEYVEVAVPEREADPEAEKLSEKWKDLLPIERRYPDERLAAAEVAGLNREVDLVLELKEKLGDEYRGALASSKSKKDKLAEMAATARSLEAEYKTLGDEIEGLGARARELQEEFDRREAAVSRVDRLRNAVKSEGVLGAMRHSARFLAKRMRRTREPGGTP